MAHKSLNLKSILDIPNWEALQDQLALLTGTAIITIDYKGNPISKHSCRTDFCSLIRENPISRKRCYKCDALAGLEAVRMGRPYIYLCHCGIMDVAVPVLVGEQYLGAVMFGQVRLVDGDADAKVERLVNEISSFQAENETARQDLLDMYNRLPEMRYERVVSIANTISALVNYIVEHAVDNNTRIMTYKWLLQDAGVQSDSNIDYIEELSETAPDSAAEQSIAKSSALYPAVAYMREHENELVSMSDMAALCHLSVSYFSRLFRKETGETFINYSNRQKVQLAKKRLRYGSDSVGSIAIELGYIDSSYFINVFKKFEGITPLAYRQHKY